MRWSQLFEELGQPFKKSLRQKEAFTKDGRKIVLSKNYMSVDATVDGNPAGSLQMVCPHSGRSWEDYFVVGRSWVEPDFRGQGIATAMYDYAFRAGFRPLKAARTQTEFGGAFWDSHIAKKAARGLSVDYHQDYPNRFHWRPIG